MSPAPDPKPIPAKPAVSWVRLVVDYAGPAGFMLAYFVTHSVLDATWALVAGSGLAIAVGFAAERRVAPLPLIWGLAALLFGVLTLVFHDKTIIKMKTTLIDAALGVAMLGGLAMGRSPIRMLMGSSISLSEAAWRRLTLRFGLFFLVLAIANEVVWRTQPDAVWVVFRFPGLLIASILFSATQAPMMMKDAASLEAAVRIAETQE